MAGVLTVTVQADVTGPLADGDAERALNDWAGAVTSRLTREATAMLRSFPMNKTGRAHGGFQSSLYVIRTSSAEARIPGPMIEGVTWSPWLEGTSSRNESTRFKGYHLFRKTAQKLRVLARKIGQEELARIMPRLGGA